MTARLMSSSWLRYFHMMHAYCAARHMDGQNGGIADVSHLQIIMLVNTIFLLSLGFLTLPLYTITVQMGGSLKAQLLSAEIVRNADRIHSLKASMLTYV